MNDSPTTQRAPSSILQVDLADKDYEILATSADRIFVSLTDAKVQGDPNIFGSLDDLLGAVYCLILAKHHGFEDRQNRPIETDVVQTRADQVRRGSIRIDGKWIAGWHFNSALFRVSAVYHRMVKLVAGELTKRGGELKVVLPKAQSLYHLVTNTTWTRQRVRRVHDEVNTLKHAPTGVHHARTATFADAVGSIGELLDLVEAWRRAP